MKSELEEVVTSTEVDGAIVGTGSYTLRVKTNRLIRNIVSMHGLKT